MYRTNIYLEEEQCAALDAVARREGTSRAAVVRALIDRALDDSPDDVQSDLDAIRASFGVLPSFETIGRGPDARSEHLQRVGGKAE